MPELSPAPIDSQHTTEALIDRAKETTSRNYAPMPLIIDRGEGSWVVGRDGTEYLDLVAGIAVSALGHAYGPLVEAIRDQAGRLLHTSNLYMNEPQLLLQEKLCDSSFADRIFLCNSGTEANEAALKLARRYQTVIKGEAQRFEIVAAEKSFHGRTMGSIAATGQPKYWEGFQPLPGGFKHVPYNDIEALEAVVGEHTAAVLLEPVQGEGGIQPAAEGYLAAVRDLCDKHGALLIFDEVQCGVGRLGTLWAYQRFGVTPDIVTWAKGIAGGIPLGMMASNEEVAKGFQPGSHASTFGGNPVAARAALVVLETLAEEGFLDRVEAAGARLRAGLEAIAAKHDAIKEVRGMGLMIGAVTTPELAKPLQIAAFEEGLLVNTAGGYVVRFVPPLNISDAEIDEALARFERAVSKATTKA